jgi:hypothetical protein
MARYSPDAKAVASRLAQEGITALYHFTSIENLPKIAESQALCSKAVLEKTGKWPPPEPGGNEISFIQDRHNDNWDKVPFNFRTCTPMAWGVRQAKHLCFFVVGPQVATWDSVVFTDTNAAKALGNQRRAIGTAGLDLINFDVFRSDPRPADRDGWHRPIQAEVLIPGQVPLADVKEVAFVSEASLNEGVRLWGRLPRPPFRVEPGLFADYPGQRTLAFNFPFLQKVVLTSDMVSPENAEAARQHKTTFRRRNSTRVTAVLSLKALTGSEGTVRWDPTRITVSENFAQSGPFTWWPHIEMRDLPDGRCSIEIWLSEVRWARIEFEVIG